MTDRYKISDKKSEIITQVLDLSEVSKPITIETNISDTKSGTLTFRLTGLDEIGIMSGDCGVYWNAKDNERVIRILQALEEKVI